MFPCDLADLVAEEELDEYCEQEGEEGVEDERGR
jgi:hypothetical protein